MSVDFGLRKENRIKRISKKMYKWEKTVVCDGVFVFAKESFKNVPAILVSIPKAIEKSSVRRNKTRRKVKEIFRKNVSREMGMDFLVKFNDCPKNFEEKLERFFKNV
tara:strand:+ start:177 stop:497 length:321 start_codon:yes stop_codon:yes gene_type:complete